MKTLQVLFPVGGIVERSFADVLIPESQVQECPRCQQLLDGTLAQHYDKTRQQMISLLLCGWRDPESKLSTLPLPAMQRIIEQLPRGCYGERVRDGCALL
jgi:hypothetical protein